MTGAPAGPELRLRMGEDLWALACSVGQEPMAGELVTPLPSQGGDRAAFRLRYPDGLQLKVRRHRDLDTAQRVLRLREALDPVHLPRLVAAQGPCHLTEWIEGETPNAGDPEVVEAAGILLGAMHGAELDPDLRRFAFPYRNWEERNRRNATELLAAGALEENEVESLLRLLVEQAPTVAELVIVHGDLAPENLVRASGGRLVLVDNENLALDAQGFDLARSWYRWPLTEERAGFFWRGYRLHADPEPFLEHAEFWKLVVLAEAAHFRVRRATPGASLPLQLLRDVMKKARDAGRGKDGAS